jgi:hypothetical protein
VLHAGKVVAEHAELKGRHGRVTDDAHLSGIAGTVKHGLVLLTPMIVGFFGARVTPPN